MAITPQQERFCREFIIDLNVTKAAVRAGYSHKYANNRPQNFTKHAGIQARIAELQKSTIDRLEITAEKVLREFAKIAFADPRSVMEWDANGVTVRASSELTDDEAATVAEVSQTVTKDGGSMKLKMHDKVAALNALGRHLALFTDKHDVSGEVLVRFEDSEPKG